MKNLLKKQIEDMRNYTLEVIKEAKKEEREECIEKLKCWYDTTDTKPDIGEIVDLLEDNFLEPWRKELKKYRKEK